MGKNVGFSRKIPKDRNEILEADELDEIASPLKSDKVSNHSSPAVINSQQVTETDYLDKGV